MKATEDISRIFRMLPWLERHPGIALEDAAREFGITPERLLDELSTMTMIGSDVDAIARGSYEYLIEFDLDEAETGRIVVTTSEYVARPLALTHDEALSLVVALGSCQDLVDEESRAHVTSALAKLDEMTSGDTNRVAVAVDHGSDDVRGAIAAAITSGQRLQLVYDGVNRGMTTRPVVDPVALVVRDGSAYLQAWSLDRDDWRVYKVTRIAEAVPTGQPGVDHGPVPELAWDAAHLGTVEVELTSRSAYLLEYDPVREVTEIDDGPFRHRARIPLVDGSYLTNRLLRFADDIRLTEPHPAQDQAVAIARDALQQYDRTLG